MRIGAIGYGIGYIGQGTSYAFVSTYFVIYMTNCVGVRPTVASSIMSISLLVEVFVGMIVGTSSDQCVSKMGKRRPYILFAAFFMPVVVSLLFKTLPANSNFTIIYYLVLSVSFRVAFACFEIPNGAFGAEIASGYDERTRLRTISRIFSIIGNFIAYIMPLWILDVFNGDDVLAWQVIGIIVAITCFVSWTLDFAFTKSESIIAVKDNINKEKNLFKNIVASYWELIQLKTMKILIVYKAAFGCGFALYNVATIYYLKYSVGLNNSFTSKIYFLSIIVFVVVTPLADRSAIKRGKSNEQKNMMLITGIIASCVFFFGAGTIAGAVIYVIAFSALQTTFWQLSNSIFYDISEVDEFVHGKRREGDIVSLVSVLGTLITSVMVQVFGALLDSSGFDSSLTAQPVEVITFLNIAYIMIPAVCFFIGAFALMKFPINRNNFNALKKAVALKNKGEDYSQYADIVNKIL